VREEGLMKKIGYIALCLFFAGLTDAAAGVDRFTASDPTDGVLGHMDFDSSVFNSSGIQFIDNNLMLALDFTNPTNLTHLTTIGPSGSGTYFNFSGVGLPTVWAGFGQQGGTGIADEVVIVTGAGGFGDPSNLILGNGEGNNLFSDVTWTASTVAAVPEPGTSAMLLAGLGLLGWHARRRKNLSS